ncbi:hypothetical protein [Paraburkholderia sp.]|uniref:hypothetical protein n=1 Tax=Paraburkholderia sp. TaxID=1926495 RepID=UPI002F41A0EE
MSKIEVQAVDVSPEAAQCCRKVFCRGIPWDLTHLDPPAFKVDPGLGSDVTVLVLFSCHCFSHSLRRDARPSHAIPVDEIYDDGKERRVLNVSRYELSRRYLRNIVHSLFSRRITVADHRQPNFVTLENIGADGTTSLYAVFLEVKRDRSRRRRLVLRVQSAYVRDNGLTKRQAKAGKVVFETLLRATYLGKNIRS